MGYARRSDLVSDHLEVRAAESAVGFHVVALSPLVPRLQEYNAMLGSTAGHPREGFGTLDIRTTQANQANPLAELLA